MRKQLSQKQYAALSSKITKISNKIDVVSSELNNAFLEKSVEIESLIIGVIANENVCLVGPAGEGKSGLAEAFTSLIGGSNCFKYQVNAYTQPDNVFGTESLKELVNNDRKILKTGNMAPEADIVYLDECFKANNSMMNALLLLLNEREVDIGEGQRVKTNNRMVIGSSNEYPEDDDLKAFWDRWVIRCHVAAPKKDSSFVDLFSKYGDGSIGVVDVKNGMKLTEIDAMRSSVEHVDLSLLKDVIIQLRFELMKNGITLSTRRWVKLFKIIAAVSIRKGRLQAQKEDVKFLKNCIWNIESEREVVDQCIMDAVGGDLKAAKQLLQVAERIYAEVKGANLKDNTQTIVVVAPKMDDLKVLCADAMKLDRTDAAVDHTVFQIIQIQKAVAQVLSDAVNNQTRR